MDRNSKIKLLNEIAAGKRDLQDLVIDENSYVIKFDADHYEYNGRRLTPEQAKDVKNRIRRLYPAREIIGINFYDYE